MQQQINRRLQQEKIKILPYNLAYTKRLVKVKIDRWNFDSQTQWFVKLWLMLLVVDKFLTWDLRKERLQRYKNYASPWFPANFVINEAEN